MPSDSLARIHAGQDFVRGITSGFLHVDSDGLDELIDDALGRLGDHLAVDRAYLFLVEDERLFNTHEWCASGVAPEIDRNQDVSMDLVAAWIEPLRRGDPVAIDDVLALPPSRAAERAHLVPQGIRSLLVVPMLSFGDLVGLVGFDAVRTERRFSRFEVGLLRSLADVITSAVVRRRSDAKAELAERRLAALTRYATDYILIVDDDDLIRFASGSWASIGRSPADLVDTPWRSHVHPDDVVEIERLVEPIPEEWVAEHVVRLPDFRVRTGDGGWRWLSGSISDVRHDGVVDGFVVNAHDVTDRRDVQDQLAHEALHDPLTGLGNRALLTEQLERACRRAGRDRTPVGIVFLDIDRFKLVNDGHGHAVGDEVLVEVGRRLAGVVRTDDVVARFGGDEFVVLLDGFADADEVGRLVARLERALDPPVDAAGNRYRVTASMGVVLAAGDELDPVAMLRDADTAMYRAKENGRGGVVVFDETLRTKVLRRLSLVHRLPQAIEENRIELAFQPIVDVVSGDVLGAEALARWFDVELGAVSPAEFIAISEETGHVVRMTEQVLDGAIAAASRWADHIRVAVNLSLSQLVAPPLLGLVESTLARHGVPAARLCIEVTESSLMHDPGDAARVLGRLRALGVHTALDDFGTGYSSLSLLRELPVDVLKIDRAFIRGVHHDERDRRLVDAVIGLARDFGMTALAEGVELPEQQRALVDAGCTLAQGYLFGRPVPVRDLEAMVAIRAADGQADQPRKPALRSQSAATTSASSSSMS